ncbi:MAG: putative bifunctional diguanylate cyclase/phosphodiesterase [Geminicoccaceae bacterium]
MTFSTMGHRSGDALLQRYSSMVAREWAEDYVTIALDQRAKLQELDLLMRNIVEQSFDGIMAFDEEGISRTANEAACALFRGSKEQLLGRHLHTLLPDLAAFRRSVFASPSCPGQHEGRLEGQACRLDSTTCPIEIALRKITVGGRSWLMAILRDITAAKAHDDKLRHLALHDALTGLPNRLLLKDRLDQALRAARRDGSTLTLAILDLDRFKEVNDTLGHQVGDALLVDVAKRLADCIRDGDTVARLGGDEFAILLPQQDKVSTAREVAERIVTAIREPFALESCTALEVGLSIGLAMFPEDADGASKLMQCADVAMYEAKRSATAVERYDPAKDINSIRTLVLSGGLRQAIDRDQLFLTFQPKLDLRSNVITSFEVLARWDHPHHGLIPPDEFIPQAEQSGNIVAFTRWTLERTLDYLKTWRRDDLDLSLALNISPRSLHSKEILAFVGTSIEQSEISPAQLMLELTETAVMLDPAGALANLEKLHAMGLSLSIDDFGTGYSSLSLLRKLPLDEIKIDKSFVDSMTTNAQDAVIVGSTISLAHNLGLKVVAEGVETEAQLAALRELDCDMVQGFLIAEPLLNDELADWMRGSPWPLKKLCRAA